MATWVEAQAVALSLPGAELGEAHEGSPAVWVRRRQFARLRWDGGRELLLVPMYTKEDADTYRAIPGYSRYVVLAALDRLDPGTVRELIVESWVARAPKRLVMAHPDLR